MYTQSQTPMLTNLRSRLVWIVTCPCVAFGYVSELFRKLSFFFCTAETTCFQSISAKLLISTEEMHSAAKFSRELLFAQVKRECLCKSERRNDTRIYIYTCLYSSWNAQLITRFLLSLEGVRRELIWNKLSGKRRGLKSIYIRAKAKKSKRKRVLTLGYSHSISYESACECALATEGTRVWLRTRGCKLDYIRGNELHSPRQKAAERERERSRSLFRARTTFTQVRLVIRHCETFFLTLSLSLSPNVRAAFCLELVSNFESLTRSVYNLARRMGAAPRYLHQRALRSDFTLYVLSHHPPFRFAFTALLCQAL